MIRLRKKFVLLIVLILLSGGLLSLYVYYSDDNISQQKQISDVVRPESKEMLNKEVAENADSKPPPPSGEVLSENSINQSANNPPVSGEVKQNDRMSQIRANTYRLPDQTQDTPLPQIQKASLTVNDYYCANRMLSLRKATVYPFIKYFALPNKSTKVKLYIEFKNTTDFQGKSPIIEFDSPITAGWNIPLDFSNNPQSIKGNDITENLEIQYRVHILEPNVYSSNWVYFNDVYCQS